MIKGSEPISVVWLKDNQTLAKGSERYQTSCEQNSHTLEVLQLRPTDAGVYVCRVSNSLGSVEGSAELSVIDKPTFVKALLPIPAVVGAPLHLQCQVDLDSGVTVTWTKDGRKIHQSPDCKLFFENKMVSLDILKTTLKDCGTYVCTVANEAGSSMCSAEVKVQGKSRQLDLPFETVANVQNKHVLCCSLSYFEARAISSRPIRC